MPKDVPMPRIVMNTISGTRLAGVALLLSVTANTTNNRINAPMNFRSISREFYYTVTHAYFVKEAIC